VSERGRLERGRLERFLSLFHQVRWGEVILCDQLDRLTWRFYPFFIRSGGVSNEAGPAEFTMEVVSIPFSSGQVG